MMDGMDDLVQFLRDRLSDDEQAASRAAGVSSDCPASPRWYALLESIKRGWELFTDERRLVASPINEFDARHAARHDPARVLAEVDAKRQIVDLHELEYRERPERVLGEADDPFCVECCGEGFPCATLRLLALPYADHPDYRDEWRPTA